MLTWKITSIINDRRLAHVACVQAAGDRRERTLQDSRAKRIKIRSIGAFKSRLSCVVSEILRIKNYTRRSEMNRSYGKLQISHASSSKARRWTDISISTDRDADVSFQSYLGVVGFLVFSQYDQAYHCRLTNEERKSSTNLQLWCER